ncbi:ABC transporter substrate-binding protein [Nocardioides convexus]|uniref:ABC transporter substrate-binding protein n=1 Tax=Nocardioides convexus TaxID=2712224 RepID=UPI0024186F62|nr:ABC transporter substrate-binding protein [Nocardioides convexus]
MGAPRQSSTSGSTSGSATTRRRPSTPSATTRLDYVSASDAEGLKQISGVSGTEVRKSGSPFEYYFYVNAKSPLLSDIDVRKAVLETVDRKQIAAINLQGLDYKEPLPGSSVVFSFQKGYEDNVSKVIPHDPADAENLLDGAGWKPGDDGIREKDGEPLDLTYTLIGDDPLEKATANALAAQPEDRRHQAHDQDRRRQRVRRGHQRAQVRHLPRRQPAHRPVLGALHVPDLRLDERREHHRHRHAGARQGDRRTREHPRPGRAG